MPVSLGISRATFIPHIVPRGNEDGDKTLNDLRLKGDGGEAPTAEDRAPLTLLPLMGCSQAMEDMLPEATRGMIVAALLGLAYNRREATTWTPMPSNLLL